MIEDFLCVCWGGGAEGGRGRWVFFVREENLFFLRWREVKGEVYYVITPYLSVCVCVYPSIVYGGARGGMGPTKFNTIRT